MSRRPAGTIEIRSEDMATPDRVASLAKWVADTLRAAGVSLSEVTLTVSNLSTRAEVRPYTPSARTGVALIGKVFDNPVRAIQEEGPDDTARDIAAAASEADTAMFPSGLQVRRAAGKRLLCTIDSDFTRQLAALALATESRRKVVRGSSQTYSKVLRVGRAREGDSSPQARIEFKGKLCEIPFAADLEAGPIFRALQTGGWCRLWLDAVWTRERDGALKLQERSSRIVRAATFEPLSGKDMLEQASPLFDVPPGALSLVRGGDT